jgi:hypothetical protein
MAPGLRCTSAPPLHTVRIAIAEEVVIPGASPSAQESLQLADADAERQADAARD